MSAVFAYARVSTNDQTVENQRLEIANAGYAVEPEFWFSDTGVSGSVPALDRPSFKAMIGKLRSGETLVVAKLDRLGRDSVDVLNTLSLLRKMKVKVVCLPLGNLDLNSPSGKLMLTMLAAVAEMEKSLLVERTKAGQKRAWDVEGKTKGRPLSTTANQRQQILERLSENVSVSQIARSFQISRGTVIKIREEARLANV